MRNSPVEHMKAADAESDLQFFGKGFPCHTELLHFHAPVPKS